MVAALLLVWPGWSSPFSGPKWLVAGLAAGWTLLLLPREARRPGPVASAALANLGACVLSLFRSDGATPWWTLAGAVLLAGLTLSATPLPWRALTSAGGLASLVVVLQAMGLDPFAAFAPEAAGTRLRLYGTLGNPDFVASVLGVTAPLTLVHGLRSRRRTAAIAGASSAVQLVALALLRSFATTVSLGAAALVAVVSAPAGRGRRRLAVALAAGVVITAIPLGGRPAESAMRGRWYLVSTAAPHVLDAPWLGQGAGTVVLHWPAWELERWQARCGTDAACVAAHPESRFAGLQDHVHDDWLERLLEGGVVGLLALVGVFIAAFRASVRSATLEGAGIAAGLASLAARATVDFPLARPADVVLLAVLCGGAAALGRVDSVDVEPDSPRDSPVQGGVP